MQFKASVSPSLSFSLSLPLSLPRFLQTFNFIFFQSLFLLFSFFFKILVCWQSRGNYQFDGSCGERQKHLFPKAQNCNNVCKGPWGKGREISQRDCHRKVTPKTCRLYSSSLLIIWQRRKIKCIGCESNPNSRRKSRKAIAICWIFLPISHC